VPLGNGDERGRASDRGQHDGIGRIHQGPRDTRPSTACFAEPPMRGHRCGLRGQGWRGVDCSAIGARCRWYRPAWFAALQRYTRVPCIAEQWPFQHRNGGLERGQETRSSDFRNDFSW
jgi:hypothetical protein